MNKATSKVRFQKINLLTIVLLFILILAGGIVRSSGSGMGCPDWPKCFGQYIPPVTISDLPKNYKKNYVDERLVKNNRFAKTLDFFGYSELARRIREDKSILVPEEFNAAKTWTEYINRLIGALSGIFLLLTAIYAFSYLKENTLIPFLSVLNVILVGIQAWLGSLVVSTNLVPVIVTIHMLLALAILALCIGTYHLAKVYGKHKIKIKRPATRLVVLLALLVSIVQIIFGTEVRENIDAVSMRLQGGYREDWIGSVGAIFFDHRNLAILVIVVNIAIFVLIRDNFNQHSTQQQLMSFTFLLVMLQVVTGIILSYWVLPPAAQALHILLASLLFGSQFYLFLNLFKSPVLMEART